MVFVIFAEFLNHMHRAHMGLLEVKRTKSVVCFVLVNEVQTQFVGLLFFRSPLINH